MGSYVPLLVVFGVLVFFVVQGRWGSGPQQGSPYDAEETSSFNRNDARHWLGGFIYNNPDDPDLMVPKRFGIGRTPNFGHPIGKLILVVPLLLALGLVIFNTVSHH